MLWLSGKSTSPRTAVWLTLHWISLPYQRHKPTLNGFYFGLRHAHSMEPQQNVLVIGNVDAAEVECEADWLTGLADILSAVF